MLSFKVTEQAIKRIKQLQQQETQASSSSGLRLSVLGGGCSGFQYKYEFTSQNKSTDKTLHLNNDAVVYIDAEAVPFLNNCTLDYIEELGRTGFEIQNPNATAKCGCGNSFAI